MLAFVAIYACLGVLAWFVTLSGLHAVTTPLAVSALIILTLRLDNLRDYFEKLKVQRERGFESTDPGALIDQDSIEDADINPEPSNYVAVADVENETHQGIENKWSERGKQIFKLVVPTYLMIILVLGLNDSNNLRRGFIENPSAGFFWSTFLFSLAMFLTAFIITDITRQREESRISGWVEEYRWLVNETKFEFSNHKIIETFETQWYGTAAVLARIFELPYGKMDSSDDSARSVEPATVTLMKFQATELQLTEKGLKEFTEQARRELNSPGWLKRVYGTMSRDFALKEFGSGAEVSNEDLVLPENCSYPVTLEEAMEGSAKGRRWPFCYEVYKGSYDPVIKASDEGKLSAMMLKTFVENPASYSIRIQDGGLNLEKVENLTDAFTKILPSEISTWVPAVFGSPETINHQVSNELESIIWWPKAINIPESQEGSNNLLHVSENYSHAEGVIVQAVRVDLSNILLLSDFYSPGEIDIIEDDINEPRSFDSQHEDESW